MKPEFENIPVVKNESKNRFEIEVNGHFAFIDYRETENQIILVHTETEPELAGTGAAVAVVEKTLSYIEDSTKKLLPFCPYVFAYIKKHPEWKRIVDKEFERYDQL
ncbi:GNAT family N-acetyltransferase [Chryseobacterium sp. T16E-39]|uniref:GNAT family N-acetyltransferase n=1 Tax=Chryseobacterium sp. T16E-39 TaxID=2015076 RepID=UPI000B5B4827|nr:GNAT family N-acetyltransferase [Chryseobacterium sp. T16E-39]ASK32053.1 GNAT family N-acetyltransferase [Chryseobacterium sp. T16E-39]